VTVRVRIAPSPTGSLHVGNARAGLFNWLFARHHGGVFILRIDDTDVGRSEEHHVTDLVDAYRWLGLDWDEGVGVGGPHGTYRQSDRLERYREVVATLLAAGHAYRDFRTGDELDAARATSQAAGGPPRIASGASGDPARDAGRAAAGESHTVRFAMPPGGAVAFEDVVRGSMRFELANEDDFVLVRSNGLPTYHLASTVDDVDYGITHVARGEDLLSSTPKHILLTRAMGASQPVYAHLPLLFGPDGRKLSKRHGDTSMRAFIDAGYLPEAMFNFMCLLGWSPGGNREVFTREEAIAAFDLTAVSRNPAVFDTTKLEWLNGEYIRALAPDDFVARVRPLLGDLDPAQEAAFLGMAPLVQERTKRLTDAVEQVAFLFAADGSVVFDEASWEKQMTKEFSRPAMEGGIAALEAVDDWTTEAIEEALRSGLEAVGISPRKGLQPLRVALTGSQVSPPLFESMAALGRLSTLTRLGRALDRMG